MSYETSNSKWLIRERNVGGQLFQGPNPDKSGEYYPGDRNLGDPSKVIVQLHRLSLKNTNKDDIRLIAIRIPEKMTVSWLAQIPEKST